MRTIKTKAGFTLIEVLIAAIILVMAGVSAILVERQAIQSSSYNKHRLQAIGLAQEGISGVNAIFSNNLLSGGDLWTGLGGDTPVSTDVYRFDLGNESLIKDLTVNGETINEGTVFTRKIYVIPPEPAPGP